VIDKYYKKGYFYKYYDFSCLVSDIKYLENRTQKIQTLTKDTSEVIFEKESNGILRKSKKIKGNRSLKRGQIPKNIANKLANFLDYQHSFGVVHGDIHPKNIIIDKNNNPIVIDYELDLIQKSQMGKGMMTTHPWIDINDKIDKIVTINTDILCFYNLLFDKPYSFYKSKEWIDILDAIKKEKNSFEFIYESYIMSLKIKKGLI
jgi:serine/threonine protein kinase